jgi:DNA-directed RNA polymerase subunit RPC12/RpoP
MADIDLESGASCPIGPPAWHYQCNECGREFDMPVPSGPREEKERTCPGCGTKNIAVTNVVKAEACPPGG